MSDLLKRDPIAREERWREVRKGQDERRAEQQRRAAEDARLAPARARYHELLAEERQLAAVVEQVGMHTDYKRLFRAEGELAALRRVMNSFPDEVKPAPLPVVPPEVLRAARADRRALVESRVRELTEQLERAEAKSRELRRPPVECATGPALNQWRIDETLRQQAAAQFLSGLRGEIAEVHNELLQLSREEEADAGQAF